MLEVLDRIEVIVKEYKGIAVDGVHQGHWIRVQINEDDAGSVTSINYQFAVPDSTRPQHVGMWQDLPRGETPTTLVVPPIFSKDGPSRSQQVSAYVQGARLLPSRWSDAHYAECQLIALRARPNRAKKNRNILDIHTLQAGFFGASIVQRTVSVNSKSVTDKVVDATSTAAEHRQRLHAALAQTKPDLLSANPVFGQELLDVYAHWIDEFRGEMTALQAKLPAANLDQAKGVFDNFISWQEQALYVYALLKSDGQSAPDDTVTPRRYERHTGQLEIMLQDSYQKQLVLFGQIEAECQQQLAAVTSTNQEPVRAYCAGLTLQSFIDFSIDDMATDLLAFHSRENAAVINALKQTVVALNACQNQWLDLDKDIASRGFDTELLTAKATDTTLQKDVRRLLADAESILQGLSQDDARAYVAEHFETLLCQEEHKAAAWQAYTRDQRAELQQVQEALRSSQFLLDNANQPPYEFLSNVERYSESLSARILAIQTQLREAIEHLISNIGSLETLTVRAHDARDEALAGRITAIQNVLLASSEEQPGCLQQLRSALAQFAQLNVSVWQDQIVQRKFQQDAILHARLHVELSRDIEESKAWQQRSFTASAVAHLDAAEISSLLAEQQRRRRALSHESFRDSGLSYQQAQDGLRRYVDYFASQAQKFTFGSTEQNAYLELQRQAMAQSEKLRLLLLGLSREMTLSDIERLQTEHHETEARARGADAEAWIAPATLTRMQSDVETWKRYVECSGTAATAFLTDTRDTVEHHDVTSDTVIEETVAFYKDTVIKGELEREYDGRDIAAPLSADKTIFVREKALEAIREQQRDVKEALEKFSGKPDTHKSKKQLLEIQAQLKVHTEAIEKQVKNINDLLAFVREKLTAKQRLQQRLATEATVATAGDNDWVHAIATQLLFPTVRTTTAPVEDIPLEFDFHPFALSDDELVRAGQVDGVEQWSETGLRFMTSFDKSKRRVTLQFKPEDFPEPAEDEKPEQLQKRIRQVLKTVFNALFELVYAVGKAQATGELTVNYINLSLDGWVGYCAKRFIDEVLDGKELLGLGVIRVKQIYYANDYKGKDTAEAKAGVELIKEIKQKNTLAGDDTRLSESITQTFLTKPAAPVAEDGVAAEHRVIPPPSARAAAAS